MKEKMIMKLEKDRLTAKVDNLEKNLAQIEENSALELKEKEELKNRLSQEEVKKKGKDKKDQYFSHKPAQIPPRDPPNPFFNEQPDMMNPNPTRPSRLTLPPITRPPCAFTAESA